MKQFGGVWLPDNEEHLLGWMQKKNQVVDGKLTYQIDKQNLAYGHCKQFRHAIDIGAHCGLWSMHMAKKFRYVDAFEPVEAHRQCFIQNMTDVFDSRGAEEWFDVCHLHECALGDRAGSVSMHTGPSSTGDTWVKGEGDIPLRRLDDILPDADNVDFIKLDCEGYELYALRGGENLIKRCKPVICVEQKPGRAEKFGLGQTDAVTYLQTLDYTVAAHKSGDYIMVPA
jgi:FkbM family methyltransferase